MSAFTPPPMSWGDRAQTIIDRCQRDDAYRFEQAHLDGWALVNERIEAESDRDYVWATMTYRCDRCAHALVYELGVGVEGPPDWRADVTYLACPFTAGLCTECDEPMTHTDWHRDTEFTPRTADETRRRFRAPVRAARQAELVYPEGDPGWTSMIDAAARVWAIFESLAKIGDEDGLDIDEEFEMARRAFDHRCSALGITPADLRDHLRAHLDRLISR